MDTIIYKIHVYVSDTTITRYNSCMKRVVSYKARKTEKGYIAEEGYYTFKIKDSQIGKIIEERFNSYDTVGYYVWVDKEEDIKNNEIEVFKFVKDKIVHMKKAIDMLSSKVSQSENVEYNHIKAITKEDMPKIEIKDDMF